MKIIRQFVVTEDTIHHSKRATVSRTFVEYMEAITYVEALHKKLAAYYESLDLGEFRGLYITTYVRGADHFVIWPCDDPLYRSCVTMLERVQVV